MNRPHLLSALSALSILSACATSRSGKQPPQIDPQLTAPVPAGLSRVIVYNSSNKMLSMDHSDRIHVVVDGREFGSLNQGEYATILLPLGRHDFALSRRAMISYETEHPMLIDRPVRWVNIRSESAGNLLDARDEPPADFAKRYHPISGR